MSELGEINHRTADSARVGLLKMEDGEEFFCGMRVFDREKKVYCK